MVRRVSSDQHLFLRLYGKTRRLSRKQTRDGLIGVTKSRLSNPPEKTKSPAPNGAGLQRVKSPFLTRFAGSFPPMLRFETFEIHTGFLHVSNPDLAKNLSPNLLAELCGAALEFLSIKE